MWKSAKTIIYSIYVYVVLSIIISLIIYFACDNIQFLQAYNLISHDKAIKGISLFIFIINFIIGIIALFINVCIGTRTGREQELEDEQD